MVFNKNRASILGIFITILASLPCISLASEVNPNWAPNKRAALIIGNGNYEDKKAFLNNPVNDAKAIAATFRQMGYDRVDLKIDLKSKDFKKSLRDFESYLSDSIDTDVVFFYAGHGIQFNGQNYLIPTDADIQREHDIKEQGVPMSTIAAYFDRDRPGANIIILDACRNNPFTEGQSRGWGNTGRGLTRIDINHEGKGPGSYISYATAPGRIADDGNGDSEHSVFTESLLKRIILPLPVSNIFQLVRSDVITTTSKKQQPEDLSRLTANVYFQDVKLSNTNSSTTSIAQIEKMRAQIEARYKAEYKDKHERINEKEFLINTKDQQLKEKELEVAELEKNARKKIKQANKKIRDTSFMPGIM